MMASTEQIITKINLIEKLNKNLANHIDSLRDCCNELKNEWVSPGADTAVSYLNEDIERLNNLRKKLSRKISECKKICVNYDNTEVQVSNSMNALPKNLL